MSLQNLRMASLKDKLAPQEPVNEPELTEVEKESTDADSPSEASDPQVKVEKKVKKIKHK